MKKGLANILGTTSTELATNSQGNSQYLTDSKGYDILIEIEDKLYYNHKCIFELAHVLGSLQDAWDIAKTHKAIFEAIGIPSVSMKSKWRQLVSQIHPDVMRDDEHSSELTKTLNTQKSHISETFMFHVKSYIKYKTDPSEFERDRAFIRTLVSYENYLVHMSKEELKLLVFNFTLVTRLPKSEWLGEVDLFNSLIAL